MTATFGPFIASGSTPVSAMMRSRLLDPRAVPLYRALRAFVDIEAAQELANALAGVDEHEDFAEAARVAVVDRMTKPGVGRPEPLVLRRGTTEDVVSALVAARAAR